MYSLTDKRLPEELNITITANNTADEVVFTPEDHKALAESIKKASRVKKRYKLAVTVLFEGDKIPVKFKSGKHLMLAMTGKYDRLIPPAAWKHFINGNLLPNKKAINHLFRITLDGEMVEF